jgi:hypothetical protein
MNGSAMVMMRRKRESQPGYSRNKTSIRMTIKIYTTLLKNIEHQTLGD